ncbi:hypothetical protein ACFSL6_09030 [Paenibacillus thailandensis]|uniref:Uncharacterized protein n=1 Tax=Paenibacillus thailandensis TaxID=393250 RepID=A0ABW5QYJ1_9BACL
MKNILVFVLFAGIVCWMMFSPIYKHVLIVRQAVLQQEVDYLLEVGASGAYGYISDAMLDESRRRLERFGLKPDEVEFEVGTTDGSDGGDPSRPLRRGTGISLAASYPYEDLLRIDTLIGIAVPSEDDRLRAYGIRMSEYVP